MGKARIWLIAPSALIALVAVTGLGRYALSATTTRLGSTRAAVHSAAANDVSCFDTSPHKTIFVTIDSGVQLEVLDWGGAGDTMVLLTGSGDNAHVYDELAYQFTDQFHVIGITRRGFGRSSQPAHGYDLDTRARDDIAVLDTEARLPGRARHRIRWVGKDPPAAASSGAHDNGSGIGAASCRRVSTRRRVPTASRCPL